MATKTPKAPKAATPTPVVLDSAEPATEKPLTEEQITKIVLGNYKQPQSNELIFQKVRDFVTLQTGRAEDQFQRTISDDDIRQVADKLLESANRATMALEENDPGKRYGNFAAVMGELVPLFMDLAHRYNVTMDYAMAQYYLIQQTQFPPLKEALGRLDTIFEQYYAHNIGSRR